MSKSYRPSNGTEGEIFIDRFCDRCKSGINQQPCPILGNSLFHNIGDPEYPKEWITDEQGSRCTAFEIADMDLKL